MKHSGHSVFIAAFPIMVAFANSAHAQSWVQTSAPTNLWYCVASSADGSKVVALANPGAIYVSLDCGTNWTLTSAPSNAWVSVASSADGHFLAASGGGSVYTSTDGGSSWTSNTVAWTPNSANAAFLASSADGSNLVAAVQRTGLFTSTNAGLSWGSNNVPGPFIWLWTASSADGTQLWAVQDSGPNVFVSTNSGSVWTPTSALNLNWRAVATTADGKQAVGVVTLTGVYITTNSGSTWKKTSAPALNWQAVASSADGTNLVASAGVLFYGSYHYGPIYTSTNAGASWELTSAPTNTWTSVASSADGKRLVAVVHGGGIYIWQGTPAPRLTITGSGGELLLSWIVPSMNFALQESDDLSTTNWTDVVSSPVLNLTNLQNQVKVQPPLSGNSFYRLKLQ